MMLKCLTFRVLLVICIFMIVTNSAAGCIPLLSDCTETTLEPDLSLPKFDPSGILKQPTVPICEYDAKSFIVQNQINQVQNSRVFEPADVNTAFAPCENNTKVIERILSGCETEEPICDLSYVVFILSMIKGKMTIVGQGIRQRNCKILTIYGVTQFGDCGLWVKYPDNTIVEVICMEKLDVCSGNILAEEIFIVQLVVQCDCCTDYGFKEPEFLTCNKPPTSPGYFVQQTDCSSTDYSISLKLGLSVNAPDGIPASFLIPNKPREICLGFLGGVFIDKDCRIIGIVGGRPIIIFNTQLSVPLVKEVGSQCVLIAGTHCAQFIPGIL